MPGKLAKPADKLTRALADVEKALGELKTAAPALLARDQESALPDGFPASTLGDGGGHGKGDHSDRTADAVLGQIKTGKDADGEPVGSGTWETRPDPIHDLAESLVGWCEAAAKAMREAYLTTKRAAAMSSAPGRHSNGPVDCLACGRTIECTAADRPIGGYCKACDTAWRRWRTLELAAGANFGNDPGSDRLRFQAWRRDRLAGTDPAPSASQSCGHPCCVGENRGTSHVHENDPSSCRDCIALLTVKDVMP